MGPLQILTIKQRQKFKHQNNFFQRQKLDAIRSKHFRHPVLQRYEPNSQQIVTNDLTCPHCIYPPKTAMVMHSDRSVLSTPSPRWKTRSAYTHLESSFVGAPFFALDPFLFPFLDFPFLEFVRKAFAAVCQCQRCQREQVNTCQI